MKSHGVRALGRVPAVLTANVAARVIALVSLTLGTILVARAGGPKLLGELALLRVLPALVGVLVCCGLPTAAPYFLANHAQVTRSRVRATLVALAVVGAVAATACWLVLVPVLHRVFFRPWGIGVVLGAAVLVFTQLWVTIGKSFLQGENDMRGANLAIAAEEAAFLPIYLGLLPFVQGTALLLGALVGADILVGTSISVRLVRHGFLRPWSSPDTRLALGVCRYGLRGQVGGVLTLLNLRLDVAILGALAGPAVLGIYAVASKYAEVLRLPGLAVTYVLYPRMAERPETDAARWAGALLPRAFVLTLLAALPLIAAVPLLPLVYGRAFQAAMIPALLLIGGLLGEGVAGVVSAYLYGVGRPGVNSLAISVAVVVTVGLDILLIPHYYAVGASFASAAAYLTSSAALLVCYFTVRKLAPVATQTAAGAS